MPDGYNALVWLGRKVRFEPRELGGVASRRRRTLAVERVDAPRSSVVPVIAKPGRACCFPEVCEIVRRARVVVVVVVPRDGPSPFPELTPRWVVAVRVALCVA